MGGRGWCLESAVDVSCGRVSLLFTLVLVLLLIWFPWETSFSLVESMEPQHSAFTGTHKITEFSTHRGQITDFWMCCLTRSPNSFLSIYTSTFSTFRAPRDHRIFFSSWRNVRPVDVLSHQITELSSQYLYINYFC
ncbi:hypothetical protein TNCV_1824201 [Trichonephila clavipes]|nr:hypothetical protein TNCV_1824201 [Trichonephila clavipes]